MDMTKLLPQVAIWPSLATTAGRSFTLIARGIYLVCHPCVLLLNHSYFVAFAILMCSCSNQVFFVFINKYIGSIYYFLDEKT
jgi:hypothetical protein